MINKTNTIKVSDIDRMINEEIARLKKVEQIKARLAVVNEELKRVSENSLDEVEVAGTKSGEEWYEKGTPVAKFNVKGTHLTEEEPVLGDEGEIELGDDMMGDDEIELGAEEAPETFEAKLAAIGRELDMKLPGGAAIEEPALGDDEISIDDDVEEAPAEEPAAEEGGEAEEAGEEGGEAEEAGEEEDEIEIDEVVELGEAEEKPALNESRDHLGKKANPILAKELQRIQRLAGL